MWFIQCILILCSIASVLSKYDLCQVCGVVKPSPRIFNGTPANYGPWAVYFEYETSSSIHFCTGTIIDFQHILTSSHCFLKLLDLSPVEKASNIVVYAGDLDKMGKKSVMLEPQAIYLHPNFSYKAGDVNSYDDIAIIKLSDPIEVNEKVKPACIFGGEDANPGDYMTMQGYGFKSFTDNSDKLLEAYLKVQSNLKCQMVYGKMYTPQHICARNEKDFTKAACPGDSGGGLLSIVKGKQNLVGISSWGGHCDGFSNEPVVFTRVKSYMNWIRNVTNNHINCAQIKRRHNKTN